MTIRIGNAALIQAQRQRAREMAGPLARKHATTVDDILSLCRRPNACVARRELYVALWQEGFALAEVGRLLGVDHTSVLYGVRRVLGRNYAARQVGGVPTAPERYMVG